MRICVFCGSSRGRGERYVEAARALGELLAARDIGLVYGGASVGTMGAVADATIAAGGSVTGVIPTQLVDREIAHPGLTDLRVVSDMHERKAMMAELSDGFIALPGGAGTLEELFEVWTWAQIGLHAKPLGLLDVGGYYQPLRRFVDHMVSEEFLAPVFRDMLLVGSEPAELLDRFVRYEPPENKWANSRARQLLGVDERNGTTAD
ncbi:TIGR00730 family Rossman fold protein [Actinoalloteichus spitiensis]|uniref:LOG family protein n=1 Tax=Actinoalloteichus spitiensis TaxID=252394 RepID=UPI00058505BE|nr:TIGR00730 family Rossman fold protein [Actinoalloteichus spitiensis]